MELLWGLRGFGEVDTCDGMWVERGEGWLEWVLKWADGPLPLLPGFSIQPSHFLTMLTCP